MESERSCEVSCSSSPSWCSAEEPADPSEMEVAKTLSDLAQFAVRERGSEFPDKMRDKGKTVRKVKSESLPSHPSSKPFDSVSSRPQHVVEDRIILTQQHGKTFKNVALEVVKPENDAGSQNSSRICLLGYSSFGWGRTRQNLTEAEKEERRLRRVLANRESARRTIRRRQALCDELTQKAAELAQENEELKKGREAALKDYELLEMTNKKLKEKIAKAMEPEITKTSDRLQAVRPDLSTSCTNSPLFLYNGSFRSVVWSAAFQSPIFGQSQEGPAIPLLIPSNIIMPALFKPEPFQEQDPQIDTSSSRAPVCVIPHPLLFPIPNQADGNHCQSVCHPKNKQCEVPIGSPCDATSSSKTVKPSDGGGAMLPNVVKTVLQAEIRLIDDLNQMPLEHESYGCEQHIDAPPLDTSQFSSSEHTGAVKHGNGLDMDVVRTNGESVFPSCSHSFC